MTNKYVINKGLSTQKDVEADWYRQEGEFFAFYEGGQPHRSSVVFTIAAGDVHTIRTEKTSAKA